MTNSSTDERPAITTKPREPEPRSEPLSLPLLPTADALGPVVTMETVVIVAIGVLATIFLASFIALVVVCRHRYCHPHHLLHHFNSKSVPSIPTSYIQYIWEGREEGNSGILGRQG